MLGYRNGATVALLLTLSSEDLLAAGFWWGGPRRVCLCALGGTSPGPSYLAVRGVCVAEGVRKSWNCDRVDLLVEDGIRKARRAHAAGCKSALEADR